MRILVLTVSLLFLVSCSNENNWSSSAVVTSAEGHKWTPVEEGIEGEASTTLVLQPELTYQEILGIGGAFTESSAALLNAMPESIYDSIIQAYFSEEGCNYTLTRTHMASCDFSLAPYSYDEVPGDTALEYFTIEPDRDDLIPMIKRAQDASPSGFNIIASPWTAPPWMKDNEAWFGGSLKEKFYPVWADFFANYIEAYAEEGIDLWGVTVENEPLGNDAHWESMHYTPETMGQFVSQHLGPRLADVNPDLQILLYDQNRGEELVEWGEHLLHDDAVLEYADGFAVHWYNSTYDVFPESLDAIHEMQPNLHLIETEGCVDAEKPAWQNDAWYWDTTATDWGFDWAKEEDKYLHRPYVPAYRYARDIIGCLNHWVEGWIDWNMVLDQEGGPNHVSNWCVAPVLVDTTKQEVYFTPLYFVMGQFSKYIKPGAHRIGFETSKSELQMTAIENPQGDLVVFVLNEGPEESLRIEIGEQGFEYIIPARSIETIHLTREIEE